MKNESERTICPIGGSARSYTRAHMGQWHTTGKCKLLFVSLVCDVCMSIQRLMLDEHVAMYLHTQTSRKRHCGQCDIFDPDSTAAVSPRLVSQRPGSHCCHQHRGGPAHVTFNVSHPNDVRAPVIAPFRTAVGGWLCLLSALFVPLGLP